MSDDLTENMREFFETDGTLRFLQWPDHVQRVEPDASRFFCAQCKRGPLFSWEQGKEGFCVTCKPA